MIDMFLYFKRAIIKKYADFSGRASRKEFLSTVLGLLILYILMMNIFDIDNKDEAEVLGGWFIVIFACPLFAVWARRLHDFGLSGWSQDCWKCFFRKGDKGKINMVNRMYWKEIREYRYENTKKRHKNCYWNYCFCRFYFHC